MKFYDRIHGSIKRRKREEPLDVYFLLLHLFIFVLLTFLNKIISVVEFSIGLFIQISKLIAKIVFHFSFYIRKKIGEKTLMDKQCKINEKIT